MPSKKQRSEIEPAIAAAVLFESDRTCCVCRKRERPVQLHHIDEDPSRSEADNLAVLCFDCHRNTQMRGGFDRKLDTHQVNVYKADWTARVAGKRAEQGSPKQPPRIEGQSLLYLQLRESNEEYAYDFYAEYMQVGTSDATADIETNTCIAATVIRLLQRFRKSSLDRGPVQPKASEVGFGMIGNSMSLSPYVASFTRTLLSLEFNIAYYYAGAAHPNTATKTINLALKPSLQLGWPDVFSSQQYAEFLSEYCVADLQRQQAERWHDRAAYEAARAEYVDEWIGRGAAPDPHNFELWSIRREGLVVHFDPYHVGSYAEGKYEVVIPRHVLIGHLRPDFAELLTSS